MSTTENLPIMALDALKRGEDATLEAVRKCTQTIEEAVGAAGGDGTVVSKITASVFEMVDRLLTVQYDFMRSVIGIGTEAVAEAPEKAATPSKKAAAS
jgi:hypothetical protein